MDNTFKLKGKTINMSIYLNHGKRVWANSLDEAIEILSKPQEYIKEEILKQRVERFFKKAIDIYDTNTLIECGISSKIFDADLGIHPTRYKDNALSQTYNYFIIDKKGNSILNEDNEKEYFEVTNHVFPKKFIENKKSYYLFTLKGQEELTNAYLNNLESVEEYGYWNNTDRLKSISQLKWNKRRSDWDDVLLNKSAIEAKEGLVLTIGKDEKNNLFFSRDEDVLKKYLNTCSQFYSVEKRKEKYLKKIMVDKIFHNLMKDEVDLNSKDVYFFTSNVIDSEHKYRDNDLSKEEKEYKLEVEKMLNTTIKELSLVNLKNPLNVEVNEIKTTYLAEKLEEQLTINKNNKIKNKM